MTSPQTVLGVDGGGTKTIAWLAHGTPGDWRRLGVGDGSASNPSAVGVAAAVAAIQQAIAAAQANAAAAVTVDAIVAGVSGASSPQVRQELQLALAAGCGCARIHVVGDAELVLAAADARGAGVGVVVGTGSAAFAQGPRSDNVLVGGWGYLIGDEGSGYWLGREALAATSRVVDGRDARGPLTSAIIARLRLATAADLKQAIYRAEDPRGAVAAVARDVLDQAQAGDPQALALVAQAGAELADIIVAAAVASGLGPRDYTLAITGGIAINAPSLKEAISGELTRRDWPPGRIAVVEHPVEGAVKLALAPPA